MVLKPDWVLKTLWKSATEVSNLGVGPLHPLRSGEACSWLTKPKLEAVV